MKEVAMLEDLKSKQVFKIRKSGEWLHNNKVILKDL